MDEEDKLIKETLDLPEAPASATLSVVTPGGYNTLFTLRDVDGSDLLEKINELETKLERLGYKPQVRQAFGKKEVEYVQGEVCPKDGGRLIKKISKVGKEYHTCENNKYDFKTGTRSGCNFVDWLKPNITWDKKKPYSRQTMTAEDYDNFQG